MDLTEFESTLTEMSTRSKAFLLVKREMEKRGHWKARNRGTKPPEDSQFSRLDIHYVKDQQSNTNDDWGI